MCLAMPDAAPENSVSPPTDVNLANRRLGDYHILRRLGRGGMGDVYLAEQESLKRHVAFKVLRPNLAVDQAYVQRFTQEARAAAKLVHANIVQIYEVGCRDGWHFISLEYVPGGNLRQLITRQGHPLNAQQAMLVMRQVAAALQKAAEQGIVHRDIKPENILLTPSGEAKVADFGLARFTGDGEALQLTQQGTTMGSPLYMSPEQAEGKAVDPRSDIYSLGATCFHMLTGRPPFEGPTALSVAMAHVKTPPPLLSQLRPDLSPALCDLVQRMLAKRPQDRIASASEILKALRTIQGHTHDETLFAGLGPSSVTEPVTLAHTRFAATQKLDQAMKTQTMLMTRVKPFSWWKYALVLVGAFLFGAILAGASAPKSVFSTSTERR